MGPGLGKESNIRLSIVEILFHDTVCIIQRHNILLKIVLYVALPGCNYDADASMQGSILLVSFIHQLHVTQSAQINICDRIWENPPYGIFSED